MKHSVVVTSEVPDIAIQILSQENEVLVHPSSGSRDEDELIAILADADGAVTLLSDPITRRVLESNANLRVVSNFAVGYNNVDLVAAKELGIVVTNTPGVLTDATADMTMALILALTRHVVDGDRFLRAGEFHGWHPLMLLGPALQGKTLGIVGLGRIGRALAQRASAFGMRVVHHSRHEDEAYALLSLPELLETSDVVSLHTPLSEETRHMIDGAALARMKRSAVLINTARGPVVDEAALARALHDRVIAGAAIDVYEHEPRVHPDLLTAPNTILLPHLASNTIEARNEMARLAAMNVALVLRGSEPLHRVV